MEGVSVMKEKLKSCPFCGDDAYVTCVGDCLEASMFVARCSGNYCRIIPQTNECKSEQEATKIWNKRIEYIK